MADVETVDGGRADVVLYSRCPVCQLVTPPAWEYREAPDDDWPDGRPLPLLPVTVGCTGCGCEHDVVDPAELLACDTSVRHDRCGAVVPCPAAAHLVRCTVARSATSGCGELIDGPAADG